mgnify:CR=1 FL=1
MLVLVLVASVGLIPMPAKAAETTAADISIQEGVTLHCWNWSYANIEANLDKIAAAGYTAVQTSPVQPLKESTTGSYGTYQGKWWVYYQPTEFKINTSTNNALGTKAQLKSTTQVTEEAKRNQDEC